MANRLKTPLDALEQRLTGPRRVALFGHRDVGKTTLLAMLYREASAGRIPGVRLAAPDPATAEYLAEKIARLEAGEPPAGTLAETELRLRLYDREARFDLIVKDYQGEHVALGSEEPIQAFFADCDAVLLCLDPEGSARPADRQRRQQEVENVLDRYIERSDDGTTGRPVALVLTKFDRVPAPASGPLSVEALAESRYGMVRHALARHVPEGKGALFAVSSYGRGASEDTGRPPAELHPLGLDAPLLWLAEQLEASDRERLEQLWELAPDDLSRLSRCVAAYEKRHPRSERAAGYRQRLRALRRRRGRRRALRLLVIAGAMAAVLAGYDGWAFRQALAFERDHPAPAVRDRWATLRLWHPTLGLFWPRFDARAHRKQDEWTVKAAALQVALGTAAPDLADRLTRLKDEAPDLAPAIRQVEQAQGQARHDDRWTEVRAEALAADEQPEKPLAALRTFLRDFPDSPRREEAVGLVQTLKDQAAAHQSTADRRIVDDLARSEAVPNVDLRDLIDRARQFLSDRPESVWRAEVQAKLEGYVKTLDERDIERARLYSRQYPTRFATRIDRYHDYLKAHQNGGRSLSEATEAKDRILREWDDYAYRLASDHLQAHPDDVAEVARRLRDYQRDHPDGRHARDARHYLDWWARVSVPGDYRVTLRRGVVESDVGKYLGGGGPDLGVVLEVAGVTYGPSPVVRNTRAPVWDYTFPRPIRWKLGDPVTIRIIDYDWSDSVVYTLNSRKGDPLALRNLSGTVKAAKGGKTTLVFASDFRLPQLSSPD